MNRPLTWILALLLASCGVSGSDAPVDGGDVSLDASEPDLADMAMEEGDGSVDPIPPDASSPLSPMQQEIIDLCKSAVGYSYYWGHGSWRSDGKDKGKCTPDSPGGGCPNCTHGPLDPDQGDTGDYGADCSGLVGKCWQVDRTSPVEEDYHPYSTYHFYNEMDHEWSTIPREQMKPADALVYRSGGSGHIVLFDNADDPWGWLHVYEARGCTPGIVYNLRTCSSAFKTIRREGL